MSLSTIFFNSYVYAAYFQYPPIGMTTDVFNVYGNSYGNGQYVSTAPSNGTLSGYQAYKAFDKDFTTWWNWITYTGSGQYTGTGNVFSGTEPFSYVYANKINGWWLQIKTPEIVVTSYSITISGSTANEKAPVDWTLLGSTNNGLTWDIIETRTGVTWTSVQQEQFFTVTTTNAFSVYRLAITRTSANDLGIQEWRLIGNPSGTPITYGWRAYVDAVDSTDTSYGVDTDSIGNVYLTGANGTVESIVYSSNLSSNSIVPINSAFLVKYNPSGIMQWRSYVDVASSLDFGYATAVDPISSNIFLVGETGTVISNIYNSDGTVFSNTVVADTSFIVKYHSNGFGNWRTYIGNNVDGKAYSVKVDTNSNAYVVGQSGTAAATLFNSNGTSSGLTVPIQSSYIVKYHSNGFVNWRAYVDAAASTDIGRGVSIQRNSANVYMVGGSGAVAATIFNSSGVSSGLTVPINSAFIVQYSSAGAVNWRAYIDAAASTDIGYGVATDSANNVYITGINGDVSANVYSASGITPLTIPVNAAFLVKYNSVGNVLWRSYIDGGNLAEISYAVATDSLDNVYITGTNQLNTATQIFNSNVYGTTFANVYISLQTAYLVKYDSTGKYIWNSQVDAQFSASSDIGYGIATDPSNNVFLVGTNTTDANMYNSSGIISPLTLPASSAFIVKFNPNGFIDDQRIFRRWPSNEITYQNWTGTSPSFAYTMTGQEYGNGVYNVTSTAPSATGYDMRCLFDNTQTADNSIGYYTTTIPAFIRIQFPTSVRINLYGIYPVMTGGAFTSWTFDGSLNGTTWVTLDTRSGVDITNKGGGWWAYVFNRTAYSYYRINFTVGSGYVRTWRMYEIGVNDIYWEFPPVALTGGTGGSNTYTTTITTATYSNGAYNARSGPNIWVTFNPSMAFDKTVAILNGNMWGTNTATYSSGTGLYSATLAGGATGGVQTTAGISGEWVHIQLPVAVFLSKYSLTGRIVGNAEAQNPSAWTILGSNNGTAWTVVDSRSGITSWYTISTQILEFTVDPVPPLAYSYYRIVITAVQQTASNQSTAIVEWRLYAQSSPDFSSRVIDSTTTSEIGYGVACDVANDVYVTGSYTGTSSIKTQTNAVLATLPATSPTNVSAAFVSKFDTIGNFLYARTIDSAGADIGYSVACDSTGNMYISGSYTGTPTIKDQAGSSLGSLPLSTLAAAFVSKFNSSGTYLYSRIIETAGADIGYSVTCDSSGNMYIAGVYAGTPAIDDQDGNLIATLPTSTGNSAFVSKFDSGGIYQYSLIIDSTGSEIGYSVACDSSGNMYISGLYTGTPTIEDKDGNPLGTLPASSGSAAFVSKFDSVGAYQYSRIIDTAGGDIGYNVACDSSGNMYIAGVYAGTPTIKDQDGVSLALLPASVGGNVAFVSKFDSGGIYQYSRIIDSAGSDTGYSVACDSSGNMYIAGSYAGTPTIKDQTGASLGTLPASTGNAAFASKFNSGGTYQYSRIIDSAGSDIGYSVACDSSGNMYISGLYTGTPTVKDQANTSLGTLPASSGSAAFVSKFDSIGAYIV